MTGNHIANQADKDRNKQCLHTHTEVEDFCTELKEPCVYEDCKMGYTYTNCPFLSEREICQDCHREIL